MIFIPFHCLQFFVLFKVNSVHIPNLLLYVLVNTSAMHFLCLSFRVGLFGIKRKASLIASSIEHDTLRFCWKTFDYRMIFTDQCDRNSGSVGSSYFSCAPRSSLARDLRLRLTKRLSPFANETQKITPVLQARQGVAWHSRQQVID